MYKPKVVLITGDMGKGKSLTEVFFAMTQQLQYGLPIFSNIRLYAAADCQRCTARHQIFGDKYYHCNVVDEDFEAETIITPDYQFLDGWKGIYDSFKDESNFIGDASFILDEAHQFIDSRNSTSKMNRIINERIGQLRKRQLDLYMSCHEFTQIDRRTRYYITHLIKPELNEEKDICILRPYKVHERVPEPVPSGKIKIFKPSRFYGFYKTEELTEPGGKYTKVSREDF